MNLQEGSYVRTTNGRIAKIESIIGDYIFLDINHNIHDKQKIKSVSNDLIDLVEEGDYVNGVEVIGKEFNNLNEEYLQCGVGDYVICTYEIKDIKSIVSKEQFESMKYVVGGE